MQSSPIKPLLIEVKQSLSICLISVAFLLCISTGVKTKEPPTLAAGQSDFVFSGWSGPALKVWTYQPQHHTAETPVVFIMHGTKRDGARYRNEWVDLAEQYHFIVVAPEFPKKDFPGSRAYNLGNVFDKNQQLNPQSQWSFSAIEPLFDEIKKLTNNQQNSYSIYGHSAGSQFVHRFLYFTPQARVTQALAANAGWYTLADLSTAFPYGLESTPLTTSHLAAAFNKNLTVLLGTEDTNTQSKTLRRTPEALAQGPHRLARGQHYYSAAQKKAQTLNTRFNWQLKYAPGVGHKNGLMAAYAAPILVKQ